MEKIKQQVYDIIQHSQNIEEPKVDKLLNNWQTNKAKFLEAFGGPIYKVGFVDLHLTVDGKHRKVDDFIDRILRVYNNLDLAHFIESNEDGFFNNTVIFSPNKDIPKGMKLLKAFKYYCDSDIELKDLQNEASRMIQEDKISGDLYFSVHPVDFLSSSENDCNWRSCHALDGEYRAGNLSYMQDCSTFMAYITSSNESYLPHFPHSVPWNSKKWRMLLHISEDWDFLFAGRQYPCELGSALSEVGKAMLQIPDFNDLKPYYSFYADLEWYHDIIKHPRLSDKHLIINNE